MIHRDIKPANVIRRKQDGKMVLIDFGAVKEIQTVVHTQGNTHLTVGIGTQGYIPLEQRAGKPRFNSDIYAVGMTAIQALTGIPPEKLPEDTKTEEVRWREQANVSNRLANILDRMVKSHYRDRYQSAAEILQDLETSINGSSAKVANPSSSNQVGSSTVIYNETKLPAVTTSQPSVIGNPAPEEPKSKRSFGLAIALAVMGAVAATLGATGLVSFLQSKPASQPVAQTPLQASPVPTETPVESPSPLPLVTPEASPSPIATATPASSPIAVSPPATPANSSVVSTSQNVVPLTDVKCLNTTANRSSASLVKGPEDETIGQEIVTAIAYLRGNAYTIAPNNPAGVACLITSPESSSRFRRLKLTFGISNTNPYTGNTNNSAVVQLTVYRDRQKVGFKETKRGEKQFWEVDVTNAQNIALEAECVKPMRNNSFCPSIVFTQADLE